MASVFTLRGENDADNPFAARLYGLGITKGRTVAYTTNSVGSRTAFLAVLCQGSRTPSDLPCSKAVKVYYGGFELAEFGVDGSRQWRFHNGKVPKRPAYKAIAAANLTTNALNITNHGYATGDKVAFWTRGEDAKLLAPLVAHVEYKVFKVDNNNIKLVPSYIDVPTDAQAIDLTAAAEHLDRCFIYKADAFLFDAEQGRPEFFSGLKFTFAGLTYIELLLPANLSTGEDEPTNLKVIVEGKLLYEIAYDANNDLAFDMNTTTAKPNPALVSADALYHDAKIPLRRFNGASFVEWRNRCNETLAWEGGNNLPAAPADFPTKVNVVYDAASQKLTKTGGGNGYNAQAFTAQITADVAIGEARYAGTDFAMHFCSTNIVSGGTNIKHGLVITGGILKYNDNGAWHTITNVAYGDKLKIAYESGILVIYKNSVPMPAVQNTYTQRFTTFYINFELFTNGGFIDQIATLPSGTAAIPRQVKRFDGHFVAPEPLPASEVFEGEIAVSASSWADIDGKVTVCSQPDRTPCFTFLFDPSNPDAVSNVARVKTKRRALADAPNFWRFLFRDFDSPILDRAPATVDLKERRAQTGGRHIDSGLIQYGVMTQSQMNRLAKLRARLGSIFDIGFEVEAFMDSINVVKGSFVYLVAPQSGYAADSPALCMVIDVRTQMSDVETRIYELQIITPDFYSDDEQGVGEVPTSPTTSAAYTPPAPVAALTLSETNEPMPDNSYVSSITGLVTFGAGAAQRGRVFVKSLTDKLADVTLNAATDVFTIQAGGVVPLGSQALTLASLGTMPEGASLSDKFYAVNRTDTTFKLSLTEGGAAFDFITAGAGALSVHKFDAWQDTLLDVTPNDAGTGAFELIPARKALTFVKVVTYSRADVTLNFEAHPASAIRVIGDVTPPAPPSNLRVEYDQIRLRFLWDKSPTFGVRGYIIKDDRDVFLAQVDAETLSYVQTAQAENVTRRVYALSSSGILSETYAQVTFVKPPLSNFVNITGFTLNADKSLKKTALTGWGNAGAILNQKVLSDRVPIILSAAPDKNNVYQTVFLTETPNVNNISNAKYGIYFLNDGSVQAYYNGGESQTFVGLFNAGDEFYIEVTPNLTAGEVAKVSLMRKVFVDGSYQAALLYTFPEATLRLPYYVGVAAYTQNDVIDLNIKLTADITPYQGVIPKIANSAGAIYNEATGELTNAVLGAGGAAAFADGLNLNQEGGLDFRVAEGAAVVGFSNIAVGDNPNNFLFAMHVPTVGSHAIIKAGATVLVADAGSVLITDRFSLNRENGVPVLRKNGAVLYAYDAASDALKTGALNLSVILPDGETQPNTVDRLRFNAGYSATRTIEDAAPPVTIDLKDAALVGENKASDIPKFNVSDANEGDLMTFQGGELVKVSRDSLGIGHSFLIDQFFEDVSSVGVTPYLYTSTFAEKLLKTNGDMFEAYYAGTFAATNSEKAIDASFGGVTIYSSGAISQNGGGWELIIRAARVSKNEIKISASLRRMDYTDVNYTFFEVAFDGTLDLSVELSSDVGGENIAHFGYVKYQAAKIL